MRSKSISKRQYWQQQVIFAEKFSGNMTEYCKHKGISFHTLQYWRHKFRKELTMQQNQLPSPFVAVEIHPPQQISTLPDAKWLAELILHLQAGAR